MININMIKVRVKINIEKDQIENQDQGQEQYQGEILIQNMTNIQTCNFKFHTCNSLWRGYNSLIAFGDAPN